MGNKTSKLTAEEIVAARSQNLGDSSSLNTQESFSVAENQEFSKQLNSSYIGKLSNEEIENFFKKYEMSYFDRIKDEKQNVVGLDVTCSDFSMLVGDYDSLEIYLYQENALDSQGALVREAHHQEYSDIRKKEPKFNFEEFDSYCRMIGSTPYDVINQDIQQNLIGVKKNYLSQRADLQEKILHDNYDDVPNKYKNIIKPTVDLAEIVIRADEIQEIFKKYGSLDNIDALLSQNK